MWRLAICVILLSILVGCSERPSAPSPAKSSAEKDVKNASLPPPAAPAAPSTPAAPPAPKMPVDTKGTIMGVAVDVEGKGVEEVAVSVALSKDEARPIGTATTDAQGRFSIDKVPSGENLVVKAVKKNSLLGVCGEKRQVSIEPGKTTDIGNIELKIPAKPKGN
jgi:hypothetical protein